MTKMRVHQLAKQLAVEPKDLIARLETMGMRGKKAQSSLAEGEVASIRTALATAGKPQVVVGEEKVVVERVVTEQDETQREIKIYEKVVERRVRANVIRRRTSRVGVVAPTAPPEPEPAQVSPEEPPGPLTTPVVSSPTEGAEPPAITREEVSLVEPRPSETDSLAPITDQEDVAKPVEEQPAKVPEEAPKGPRVLGRIDLKRGAQVKPVKAPSDESPVKVGPVSPIVEGVEERKEVSKREDVKGEGVEEEKAKPAKPVRHKKRVIKKQAALELREQEFRSGRVPRKKRALPGKEQKKTEITVPKASKRIVKVSQGISVGDLAKSMGVKAGEITKKIMGLGMMATINQIVDADTAALVASEFDYQVENVTFDVDTALGVDPEVKEPDAVLHLRPPIVTMMGHVDHGKTSLLDAIRSANVTGQEAGGITQHIGAYRVDVNGRSVTFLDTPGHEAFTAMRARGAKVTDIVALVVAADDGVMPQTVEAINHARAAEVPMVVAINKIDKPEANVERVKRGLSEHGLVPEDWGGDTILVPVSAKTKQGIPELLEMLLLQADLLELKANPAKLARGAVVEARLDRGRGSVATVLVLEGTLRAGDPIVCGNFYGRVRAIFDDSGRKIEEAPPSLPVEILGLQGTPQPGESFAALSDEAKGREIAEHRSIRQRETELAKTSKISLEEFYEQVKAGDLKELRLVLKGDVHGSVEALTDSMDRLSNEEVKLRVIHGAVGGGHGE